LNAISCNDFYKLAFSCEACKKVDRMKILLSLIISCISTLAILGQGTAVNLKVTALVQDKFVPLYPSSTRIVGYLGDKINLVIEKRIKAQDQDYLVEPFRHKEETHLWQTEFWGKWILSAIAAYQYDHDPALSHIIKNAVKGLLSTQMADGYIGNYSDSSQLQQWDIWGQKYTLLGLLAYYDMTGDKSALKGACHLADHLLSLVGPGKVNIVRTGNYRGMPSSSILEPMVSLYRHTADKRYLAFAKYIVDQWETPCGPQLIGKALKGIPVAERFPHPDIWWSFDNGQKAYEMMSCYDGLLDLYRITGEPSFLMAVEMAVNNIIKSEINVAGSGSAFECFYSGARYQTIPAYHTMETCVTMTWMKLCFNLLKLTGNPLYADQIEKSTYNALMASVKDDGSQIAKYSPMGGVRHAGEEQCGMHINCCNANGPRAFTMLPGFAVMTAPGEIFINMYGNIESVIPRSNKNKIVIRQLSGYPVTGKCEFVIDPGTEGIFTIGFRIPSWSENTFLAVNSDTLTGVNQGQYKAIKRLWKKGDRVILELDMRARLFQLDGKQSIIRGPVVLARDTRFGDGSVSECAVIKANNGVIDLRPSPNKPSSVWMSFTAPLVLGTDLEGAFRNPRQIGFCDFASAGNTWGEDSRYAVWIPRTLNVMDADYSGY
jgi:uncharacterized protein